ncbi:GlsB/YeaQ/YmgE family stress response membrane protein [Aurantiacibacter spongiae]|uniref:GlsB/YeaQ/YmgE family stress response membrane protein n=1 Tax=Aurantiacibacter spongiae TaxID=2488860 RepID=A0A3N5CSI7_9SPHN|nr:GlsB/YeaQ/YmgE family stress response membrane protein [Aurantiacibacter spongiae]RPF71557.1 GlsB/YeaQ/YmgE family stress response membrane protein [Aurantiacibacter spongiae]
MRELVGLVFMVVAGAIVGWIAAFVARSDGTRALQHNVAAGILGALVAGIAISPALGTGEMLGESCRISALLVSLAGAVAFILPLNLFRLPDLR